MRTAVKALERAGLIAREVPAYRARRRGATTAYVLPCALALAEVAARRAARAAVPPSPELVAATSRLVGLLARSAVASNLERERDATGTCDQVEAVELVEGPAVELLDPVELVGVEGLGVELVEGPAVELLDPVELVGVEGLGVELVRDQVEGLGVELVRDQVEGLGVELVERDQVEGLGVELVRDQVEGLGVELVERDQVEGLGVELVPDLAAWVERACAEPCERLGRALCGGVLSVERGGLLLPWPVVAGSLVRLSVEGVRLAVEVEGRPVGALAVPVAARGRVYQRQPLPDKAPTKKPNTRAPAHARALLDARETVRGAGVATPGVARCAPRVEGALARLARLRKNAP